MLRTPNWDDFVQLACCEILLYGRGNFQIARRLRAMIEDLIASSPERRHPPLHRELRLLDQMIDRLYLLPQDQALARTPDMQCLGSGTIAIAVEPAEGGGADNVKSGCSTKSAGDPPSLSI